MLVLRERQPLRQLPVLQAGAMTSTWDSWLAAQAPPSANRRLAMVDVPPFADGAVAELRHGADGTVIAEIRIPGPADGADEPRSLTFADVERMTPAQCEAESAVLRDRIAARLDHGQKPPAS